MDKEEFERLKAEEKAHLQKLRQLKGQHRDAQRKASTVNALNNMMNNGLDKTGDATDKLMRDAAQAEARFDLALEGHAPVTGNADELDRADLAKAEAEALVRQMKVQMGAVDDTSMVDAAQAATEPSAPARTKDSPATGPGTDPATTDAPTSAAAPLANDSADKTIGRAPLPDDPPAAQRGDKSIGRSSA